MRDTEEEKGHRKLRGGDENIDIDIRRVSSVLQALRFFKLLSLVI